MIFKVYQIPIQHIQTPKAISLEENQMEGVVMEGFPLTGLLPVISHKLHIFK